MPLTRSPIKKQLYPPVEAWDARHLDTGDGHEIYVEQSGRQGGIPVVFVHGGPGGGSAPAQRRFFDPAKYHIILFDQRGCGRSRPHASLENNTTWHLVDDMELIRRTLGLKDWVLFGGSWGSTLSLLYAQKHPERVRAMILRGIFMSRQSELDWFYQRGTRMVFPDAWEAFESFIPAAERGDMITAYHKRLTGDDPDLRLEAARRWSVWETSSVTLVPDPAHKVRSETAEFALAFARIEAHYFINQSFLEADDQIIRDAHLINHIPTWIVQGRYDAICPPGNAWDLAKALPGADLRLVSVAGHSAFEGPIIHELVSIMDDLKIES